MFYQNLGKQFDTFENLRFRKNKHILSKSWESESESEFFCSVFSPNGGKCRPDKLRIRTLFTQCLYLFSNFWMKTFVDKALVKRLFFN